MDTQSHLSENSKMTNNDVEHNIDSIIDHGKKKIKQITRRISENDVKLESMESHSDYEYNDLLREYNEAAREHKKDLSLFLDLLHKYNILIK